MKIKVNLLNELKKYNKNKLDSENYLQINKNFKVKDLIEYLEIPAPEDKIILVNDEKVDFDYQFEDEDEIVIYSLMVGG